MDGRRETKDKSSVSVLRPTSFYGGLKELGMNATIVDHGSASETPQKPKTPIKARSAKWLVAGLLLLSAFPLAAGAFRLSQLAGGAAITPANSRFFASPLPVVVHIVGATVYALLGAFQFANGFR